MTAEQNPPVTWLLSTKNSMPYLRETLASIENQTYRNYRLLVWDDCSTDGSLEELRGWIPTRIPGRIFAGRSMSLGASLTFLIEQADTELCARIDGDDINGPRRLEQQVMFMQSHPHVGALGGQIDVINEEGISQDTGPFWKYETDDASVRWRSRWQAQFCHPTVILRKTAVLAAGNYRDLQAGEDTDLWVRMANVTELRNLPDKVLQYRRSSTSSTGRIVEYLSLERRAATGNTDLLFPTVDQKHVMDLWEASHPYYLAGPSKFRHIREIKKAAVALAHKVGKPADYFTNTELFQEQQDTLKKRFYARAGLMRLVKLRQLQFRQ